MFGLETSFELLIDSLGNVHETRKGRNLRPCLPEKGKVVQRAGGDNRAKQQKKNGDQKKKEGQKGNSDSLTPAGSNDREGSSSSTRRGGRREEKRREGTGAKKTAEGTIGIHIDTKHSFLKQYLFLSVCVFCHASAQRRGR